MSNHVTSICASCNFHLCRLSAIRRHLTTDAIRFAVQALITSRLDYCNSLLAGLPATQIARLQRIQNKAARLVTMSRKDEHITPVLQSLHWLPMSQRITFKLMVLVYKCLHGLAPNYLCSLLKRYARDSRLRQVHSTILSVPVSKRQVGNHAFGISASHMWNELPEAIRAAKSLDCFKRALKTHLFKAAFS